MSTQEYVQSGYTYQITNAKSGTVVDLSGYDNTSIIGYPNYDTSNQQWTLEWTSAGWTFQSRENGLYININGTDADGTKLVADTTPLAWDIWHDEADPSTYRIFVPNTSYNWDLYGNGSSVPGTPITLWYQWLGIHQTWKFTRV